MLAEAAQPKIKIAMLRDISHVFIKWPSGDITIVQQTGGGGPNGLGVSYLTDDLLKELRPLIQTFE